MLKKTEYNRKQIELLCLEQLVPEEHLVRKIEHAIDFSFIYDEVKDLVMLVEIVLTLFL